MALVFNYLALIESTPYRKLVDSVQEYEDNDFKSVIDFVILPPENVDSLTDTEDNYCSNFDDIRDINLIPETCGEVEVFSEFVESTSINNLAAWTDIKGTQIPPETFESIELPEIKPVSYKSNFSMIKEKNLSSCDIFLQFLDENLLTLIVKQSNIYARQNNNHEFHLFVSELKSFIGILILWGYHRLTRQPPIQVLNL